MILINDDLRKFAREYVSPEPHVETNQIDLSVGSVDYMTTHQQPMLMKDSRLTADLMPLEPNADVWKLRARCCYQITTAEEVRPPANIYMRLSPRRTTFASGLVVLLTNVSPGYMGKLSFTVIPMLGHDLERDFLYIEKGFRIISATCEVLEGESEVYNGFWQGGRPEGTGNIPGSPV